MPLCADPQATLPFVLTTDRQLPAESRPTFNLRFITEEEAGKARRLILDAGQQEDDAAAREKLNAAIKVGLVGTRGIMLRGKAIAADAEPHTYLTTSELWELAYAVLREPNITEDDKKKSAGSPPSEAERLATAAPAASA